MKITKAQREMISRVYDKVPWDIVQQSHSKGIKIHDIIINLLSISKSLNKSYCFSCSYPQTDEQEKRRDKREARLEQSAKELAALIGLHCYIQHDPRGYAVHLMSDSDIKYDQIGKRYRDVDDYMEHNYYPMAVPLG